MKLIRLTQLRKERKWTLQETADQLGIAKSTYAGYESGYRQPSLDSLIKLADIMDTSIDYLLNRIEDSESPMNVKTIHLDQFDQNEKWEIHLDDECLTKDELNDFIAFVRAKRLVEKSQSKHT
ncbi:helix-turn-helix domain-containing protein [Jeotgalibacillus sp. S-D1]|uniref:helix-turn-helix domain-containing protein n=1 Tax=Jeotgalibacillus sp. S-D1 TaxID=2552189 RepID=UPI00105A65E8|nr:helix-turn-helix transcriptional regulator [Jeotgalibacillus sp. S-D1]TDL32866.1 helix-turn-helix domain-containing protein [Jeotgalibacillus sp. S-D1]